jgi:DNA anti-recombination protein RmuC
MRKLIINKQFESDRMFYENQNLQKSLKEIVSRLEAKDSEVKDLSYKIIELEKHISTLNAHGEYYAEKLHELPSLRNKIQEQEQERRILERKYAEERENIIRSYNLDREELIRSHNHEKDNIQEDHAKKCHDLNKQLIEFGEKIIAQEKLEKELRGYIENTKEQMTALIENTKEQITSQNRVQLLAMRDDMLEKNKLSNKETEESLAKIMEESKATMLQLEKNLNLQHKTLCDFKAPVERFEKILGSSKESGYHGEETLANQLEAMGLKYGIDYFTQYIGKSSGEEKLIADVVLILPNQGKKDILIIDCKSSMQLGLENEISSIENSFNIFARKDYKNSVERRIKEDLKCEINHTHVFMYLPFDKMLASIQEQKPDLLKKMKDRNIGILTPVLLDFLLDTIKLYSAKVEMNQQAELIMNDVRTLIERTSVILEGISALGKSIGVVSKRYDSLQKSVGSRFVKSVNKMAKPLNLPPVRFEEVTSENMKEVSAAPEEEIAA